MSARGRIAIHVPYLYPLLNPAVGGYAGGLEVQQEQFARGLAARGFDVHVATCDYGQPSPERLGSLTVWKTFPPHGGLPVVRFLHPRLTGTVAALWRAHADVYFMKGAGLLAGVTADVAHARGAAFAWLAAHDEDTRRAMPNLGRRRERWWWRRALAGADLRLVQTEAQRTSLAAEWGLEARVLRSPVPLPPGPADAGAGSEILWIATYKDSKRPTWFTELAARMPEHRFTMCGIVPEPPLTREAYDAARERAAALPNLEVLGFVEHDRIGELYRRAAVLVHTSPAEGFSNVFLEAWAHGLPTVTSVDPDGVVAAHGMGLAADTLEAFEAAIRRLMADPASRRALGARAREYVRREHDGEAILDRFAALLDPLVARRAGRRGT